MSDSIRTVLSEHLHSDELVNDLIDLIEPVIEQDRDEAHTAATNLARKVNDLWAQVAILTHAIDTYISTIAGEEMSSSAVQAGIILQQQRSDTAKNAAQYVRALEHVVKVAHHVVGLDDLGDPVEVDRRLQNLEVALERLDALTAKEDRG